MFKAVYEKKWATQLPPLKCALSRHVWYAHSRSLARFFLHKPWGACIFDVRKMIGLLDPLIRWLCSFCLLFMDPLLPSQCKRHMCMPPTREPFFFFAFLKAFWEIAPQWRERVRRVGNSVSGSEIPWQSTPRWAELENCLSNWVNLQISKLQCELTSKWALTNPNRHLSSPGRWRKEPRARMEETRPASAPPHLRLTTFGPKSPE